MGGERRLEYGEAVTDMLSGTVPATEKKRNGGVVFS
jgi:hypothetical protein